jgi:hypothetical protein
MPLTLMITSYEDSVLAYTDEDGCLPPAIANELIKDHYLCMADYLEETRDTKFHASELLNWLGY